jgi:hypothetical protein
VFAGEYDQPFFTGDQDALNALLMSEVPRESMALLPPEEAPLYALSKRWRCSNARNLVCTHLGRRTTLLHYSWTPKAWERRAWPRIRRDAYVQLLRRVLFASDVTVRLDPAEFPLWLKPGTAGNLSLHTLTTANRAARTVLYGMPPQIRGRLLSLYNQFLTRP